MNNPINRYDESGHVAILTKENYWQNVAEGGAMSLHGDIDIGDSVNSLIGTLIAFIAALMSLSETDVDVDTSTKPNTPMRVPYYGARIYAGEFQILTPPMDLGEAIAWTVSAMALGKYIDNKKNPTRIGRSTSWGIYAETAVDASAFAVALGGALGIMNMSQLVNDKNNGSGIYDHYHMPERDVIYNGKLYKHFHIWYGKPMP